MLHARTNSWSKFWGPSFIWNKINKKNKTNHDQPIIIIHTVVFSFMLLAICYYLRIYSIFDFDVIVKY